jgi:tetratricopeptide (TPR) repeat protein
LLRIGLGLTEPEVEASALDDAWARGAAPSPAARAAAALVLGVVSPEAEPVARLLEVPGALRQGTARALSLALGRAARQHGLLLLLDDAHLADHAVLDGLELATMIADDEALSICVSALPALTAARPGWGNRAVASRTFELSLLDEHDSRAVLADLLRPLEFVPGPAMASLSELAEGVPSQLVELAHAVRGSGVVRQSPGRAGYMIASDELLEAAARPLIDRLSLHLEGRLPEIVAPFAHLCALFPDGIDEEITDGVRQRLPASDGLNRLDAAAALERLVRQSILVRDGARYRMRPPLMAAIERSIPPSRRRELHAAALAFLREHDGDRGMWIAHHAVGAGEHEIAAAELAVLGDRARARHRYVAAEQHYSAALEQATPDSPVAEAALAGRGRVRYRLQRFDEAIADLRAARMRAHGRGDRRTEAELMFEEATALDWTQNWTASAELARQALPLAQAEAEPGLLVKAELAIARSALRDQRYDQAVESLARVIIDADRLDLYEERVIARLVLGAALLYQYRVDEAESHLEDVMAICRASGDDLHLAAAHTNRQVVAVQRHDVDRALEDLAVCVRLSRELGNAQLERAVSFNYGEFELWRGNYDDAFAMAARAHELQLGFQTQYSRPEDALLLARIECARHTGGAGRYLTWIHESCSLDGLPPVTQLLVRCVTLFTYPGDENSDVEAWSNLVSDPAAAELIDERIEMLLLGAEALARHGRAETSVTWLTSARAIAKGSSLWEARLQLTAARILP